MKQLPSLTGTSNASNIPTDVSIGRELLKRRYSAFRCVECEMPLVEAPYGHAHDATLREVIFASWRMGVKVGHRARVRQ